jgi:protein-tyrosine phosphatase
MAWRPTERSRNGGVDRIPLPTSDGSLWLCGKHVVGPDPDAALRATGATTVVCLTERHEVEDRYPGYADWLRAVSATDGPGRAVWHPMPDLGAPHIDDAVALLDDLADRLRAGDGLLVHCGAGIGRAGTVAAALLMELGLDLDDAVQQVAAHRPMAGPEAGAQRELLVALAARAPRAR